MKMLNLETIYPRIDMIATVIDESRRVEINYDLKPIAAPFFVCTFEPGKGECRTGCWTLREAIDLANKELDRIRANGSAKEPAAMSRP